MHLELESFRWATLRIWHEVAAFYRGTRSSEAGMCKNVTRIDFKGRRLREGWTSFATGLTGTAIGPSKLPNHRRVSIFAFSAASRLISCVTRAGGVRVDKLLFAKDGFVKSGVRGATSPRS